MLTASYSSFVCISEINKTETDNYLNHCKLNLFIKITLPDCRKVNTLEHLHGLCVDTAEIEWSLNDLYIAYGISFCV